MAIIRKKGTLYQVERGYRKGCTVRAGSDTVISLDGSETLAFEYLGVPVYQAGGFYCVNIASKATGHPYQEKTKAAIKRRIDKIKGAQ